MTRDEWNELASALAKTWQHGDTPTAPTSSTVESVAQDAAAMRTRAEARMSENVRPPSSSGSRSTDSGSGGSSIATDVVKTVGMVTGIGPVVTGLLKLFGSGSDDSPATPAPVRYELPSAVHVEAGLMPDRGIAGVTYGQNDSVRRAASPAGVAVADDVSGAADLPATTATASGPTIQIQVNAMDSRSFLDHSDEIAQAVRNALLRSHSLNDVISEI